MHKIKKLLVSIGIGLAIGGVLATGIILLKFSIHGKFSPGTTVANIDISYLKPQEAKELLENEKAVYLNAPLKIEINKKIVKITPKELGVDVFVDATIEMVKETDAAKLDFITWFIPSGKKHDINILTKIDNEKLISGIRKKLNLKKIEPRSANFYLDQDGNLNIKDGHKGWEIDYKSLIEEVKISAQRLSSKKITLTLKMTTPQLTKETLEKHKEEIETSLNHKIALIDPIYSDDWYIKLIDYPKWVTFEEEERVENETIKKIINIKINKDELNAFIDEKISKWLDVPAENVKIYRDEKDEVVIEGQGNDGLKVDRDNLKREMEIAAANKINEVVIPVIKIQPEIIVSDDLKKLGIKERLGVGHTSYYNSPKNRVFNIKNGSSKFNGNLIAPGEIFSFNANLGLVNAITGYKKELVIKEEGTIPEYGGGICQVSTTMYRTILFSGLPVVERNPHSYAVSYYSQVLGHGLDATIYLGGSNLRFLNDTGNHILIQTYTKNDYELYIIFYGTSDGRTVEMEGPYLSNYHKPGPTIYQETTDLAPGEKKQVEKAHTGFYALWYRRITKDGETKTEKIESAYRAIPAKILVGAEAAVPSK